jgi:hypothetical protein
MTRTVTVDEIDYDVGDSELVDALLSVIYDWVGWGYKAVSNAPDRPDPFATMPQGRVFWSGTLDDGTPVGLSL